MRYFFSILFLALFLLSGCSQKEVVVLDAPQIKQEEKAEVKPDTKALEEMALRSAIVKSALSYLNKNSGKDCSGFVELVNFQNEEPYYKSSDLAKYYDSPNRSKAIFNAMKAKNMVFDKESPKVGDLVFFEDTLQKSKRKIGSFNITHVGIVTQVDSDGTIHFIHNTQGKNQIDQLNIKFADAQILGAKNINSYLKRCDSKKPKEECLSSYFFSAFATPTLSEPIRLSKN